MRKLKVGESEWKFAVGRDGVGIIDPRDGKRHNVRIHDFFMVLGRPGDASYACSGDDSVPVGPGDVRAYIDTVFLKTRELPRVMVSPSYHVAHVYAHRAMKLWDVMSSLEATCPGDNWALCPDDSPYVWHPKTNPQPARFSPETHVMYFFERSKNNA